MPTTSECPYPGSPLCNVLGLQYSTQYGTYVPASYANVQDPLSSALEGMVSALTAMASTAQVIMANSFILNPFKAEEEMKKQFVNAVKTGLIVAVVIALICGLLDIDCASVFLKFI